MSSVIRSLRTYIKNRRCADLGFDAYIQTYSIGFADLPQYVYIAERSLTNEEETIIKRMMYVQLACSALCMNSTCTDVLFQ
jgi:hypothetical protein